MEIHKHHHRWNAWSARAFGSVVSHDSVMCRKIKRLGPFFGFSSKKNVDYLRLVENKNETDPDRTETESNRNRTKNEPNRTHLSVGFSAKPAKPWTFRRAWSMCIYWYHVTAWSYGVTWPWHLTAPAVAAPDGRGGYQYIPQAAATSSFVNRKQLWLGWVFVF